MIDYTQIPQQIKVKVKLAQTRLPSVGFRSWSRFLAVSLQVTWVINPAVGCQYFPPGPQLPPATLKRAATNFAARWTEAQWVWTVCLRLLPDSVATAIELGPFCAWVQHANHSATEPAITMPNTRRCKKKSQAHSSKLFTIWLLTTLPTCSYITLQFIVNHDFSFATVARLLTVSQGSARRVWSVVRFLIIIFDAKICGKVSQW